MSDNNSDDDDDGELYDEFGNYIGPELDDSSDDDDDYKAVQAASDIVCIIMKASFLS